MPMLTPSEATRAGALYLPLLLALLLGIYRRHVPVARLFPAVLLSALWMFPSLLLLQQFNLRACWWSYAPGSAASLKGMPLELYLGWAVLWGVLPALALPWFDAAALPPKVNAGAAPLAAGVLVALDLLLMPACRAAVTLGPRWLVGEAVAVALVLLPALVLARITQRGSHTGWRAGLQVVLAAGLFLYWIPELTAALSHTALRVSPWWRELLVLAVLLALPGLGAVQEFAGRGRGTPIPYDPPRRLVVSGIYRYLANPMQLSCSLVMLVWPLLLRNLWLLVPASLAVVYSAGLAEWDEGEDLRQRFGEPWLEYRRQVRNWLPRLRPYAGEGAGARLYFAHGCGVCSELGRWVAAQGTVGLELLAAESLEERPTRLMYLAATGEREYGTRAFARALEHMHLGYAVAGTLLRLPGPAHLVQVVMDAAGFDEQVLPGRATGPQEMNAKSTESGPQEAQS